MKFHVQVIYFQVAPIKISEGAEEARQRRDKIQCGCDFIQVLPNEVPTCSHKVLWTINGTSKVQNPQTTPSHWLRATHAHGLL